MKKIKKILLKLKVELKSSLILIKKIILKIKEVLVKKKNNLMIKI